MSKPFRQRVVIGIFLIAGGAALLVTDRSAGLAWALILWALFVVASTPGSRPRGRGAVRPRRVDGAYATVEAVRARCVSTREPRA